MLLILSKLFPCFSCCQNKNAQIVHEINKLDSGSEHGYGFDSNKQVIENRIENLGELTADHTQVKEKIKVLDSRGKHDDVTEEVFAPQDILTPNTQNAIENGALRTFDKKSEI